MDPEQIEKYLGPYFEVPEDWNLTPWQTAVLAVSFNPKTRSWICAKTLRQLREEDTDASREKIKEVVTTDPFPELQNLTPEEREEYKKILATEILAMKNALQSGNDYEEEFNKLNKTEPAYLPGIVLVKEPNSNIYRPINFKDLFKNLCGIGEPIPFLTPNIRKNLLQKYKTQIKMYKENGR